MASSLGSLVVSLAANTAEFASDLGKAAHLSEKRMGQIRREAEKVAKAIGLMFVAGVGTAAVLVKQAIDAQDAMQKLAQGSGLSTKAFSELAFAAKLGGVEMEQFGKAMAKLAVNMSDTVANTGEALLAFRVLGINVQDAQGALKTSDVVFAELADKFAAMEDGAGKTAIAYKVLGKAGTALIPTLNMGSKGLQEMREEAVALGASIDSKAGMAAERFNDNLTRLNVAKQGLANTISEALLPSLNDFTDELVETAKTTDAMNTIAEAVTGTFKVMLSVFIAAGAGARILGDSIGKLMFFLTMPAGSLGDFKKAFEFLATDSSDMASVIERAAKSLDSLWDSAAKSAEDAAKRTAKASAPIIESLESINKAKQEAAKIADEAAKQEQKHLDRVAEQSLQDMEKFELAEELADLALEKERERRQMNIDNLTESLLTEEERELESYERRIEMIKDAVDRGLIVQQEADDIAERLAAQHEKRMVDIRKRNLTDLEKFNALSWQKQTQTIIGELTAMTAGVANQSKALFNLNKAAGIANAIINAYIGISKTLAAYPYPWNIALAAAHAVVAFAQVRSIASQSFTGGGAAAPSLAGSTAATPVTPVTSGSPGVQGTQGTQIQQSREVSIHIQGSGISREQLEELATELSELGEDGFPLRFKVLAA